MQRKTIAPRPDWRARLRVYPYAAQAVSAAVHWDESACYAFSAAEIDRIEGVADELHAMVIDAVRHVIERRLFGLLGIRPEVARLIEDDWRAWWHDGRPNPRHGLLFGRLDLAHDGGGAIKLTGCHYDGPLGLLESAVVQWNWLEDRFPDADQFNGLHEGLVERLRQMCVGLRGRDHLHLSCAMPDPLRAGELAYLRAVAEEAGLAATVLPIQDIGWDGRRFRDTEARVMSWLLKLYPWEGLVDDDYGRHLRGAGMAVLEPAWAMLASNHGLLAILWELYREHPNLVPASFEAGDIVAPVVERRGLFGLERAASRVTAGGSGGAGRVLAETGPLSDPGGYVHLARPAPFEADGRRAQLQAWIVGDTCLGMAVRETGDAVVGPDAALVPHFFTEA